MGRDSSLDSDWHSSILGVFGVPTELLCLTKFTGESISGLLSNTLPSWPSFFSKFKSSTLFFPISLQTLPAPDPEPKYLLHRSWARVPGFKYLVPDFFNFLLPFLFSVVVITFPIELNQQFQFTLKKKNKNQIHYKQE